MTPFTYLSLVGWCVCTRTDSHLQGPGSSAAIGRISDSAVHHGSRAGCDLKKNIKLKIIIIFTDISANFGFPLPPPHVFDEKEMFVWLSEFYNGECTSTKFFSPTFADRWSTPSTFRQCLQTVVLTLAYLQREFHQSVKLRLLSSIKLNAMKLTILQPKYKKCI